MARPRKDATELATEIASDPAAETKLYPVLLLRHYRPIGEFMVQDHEIPEDDESPLVWRAPTEAERAKTRAGNRIKIGEAEARRLFHVKAAERADEFFS